MTDDQKHQARTADFRAAIKHIEGRAKGATQQHAAPPIDVLNDVNIDDVLADPERVQHIALAAYDFVATWQAAKILGLANSNGAEVPVLLRRLDTLIYALAGKMGG